MSEPPCIETARLLLGWPTPEQIDGYHRAIVGTAMFDTILWDGPTGPDDLHEFWARSRARQDPGSDFDLAVIERESGSYVGGVSLRPSEGDPTILDVGYALAPHVWGLGYATEAVGALVDEAFRARAAERIASGIFEGNHASRRVVEKLGFHFEGTLRRAVRKRGVWRDEWLLAITRPDWRARR